jgi:hypothetical protein
MGIVAARTAAAPKDAFGQKILTMNGLLPFALTAIAILSNFR